MSVASIIRSMVALVIILETRYYFVLAKKMSADIPK
jgi:hypothetical protein